MTVDPAHASSELERRLDEHGLTWELQLLELEAIDWSASLAAQLRTEPVDEETVERYAETLAAGDAFPAILVAAGVILGGVHRAMAHQAAELDEIPAYVITDDVDEDLAVLLSLLDNSKHGDQLDHAAKDRQALRLVERGYTHAEAARAVGSTTSRVAGAAARAVGTDRARRLALANAWASLKPSSQARLQAATSWDDDVFAEAVRTCWHSGLTTGDVFELAAQISATDRDRELALLAVEDFEAEHAPGGGGGRRRTSIATVRSGALELLELDAEDMATSCNPADRSATADLLTRARNHLDDIIARLNGGT